MWNLKLNILILFMITSVNVVLGQDIEINATVDKNPVGLDEQFTYEVEVSGSSQNLPDVNLPDFSEFAVLGGPNVSSSFQIINFNMTASKTYSIVLMPKKIGKFNIGSASVKYKGNAYQSNAIEITVQKQSSQPSQQGQSTQQGRTQDVPSGDDISKIAFIKAIPSKTTAYVNEEITVRYKIYFRTNITNNQVSKLPEAVGCWVEEYPTPNRPRVYNETVNGMKYNVAEIRKVAAFPSRPGNITISPLEMIVDLVVRKRRSRDIFDDFFGDPFGQVVKRRLSSGSVKLKVLPLPSAGKPENFSGLVGDFKVHSSLDKKSSQTNEAISYKVKISGAGLLKFLNELPVTFPPDFEAYEPKINESLNKTGGQITSNKEFEYVLIPRVPGEFQIRSYNISYFNPEKKQYLNLKVPDYTIQVTKGKELAAGVGSGAGLSKEKVKLLGSDIRFIKESPGKFRPVGKMPYESWWVYLSVILPLAVLGISLIYRNHLEKMSTNVQYARSRKAHRQAQHSLREAKSFWKANKVGNFYGAISRALLGYLADKTNQSAAGLVREDVQSLLERYGVDTELQTELQKCMDEADFRRFAPGEVKNEDMKNFYDRAEKILVKLSKYF